MFTLLKPYWRILEFANVINTWVLVELTVLEVHEVLALFNMQLRLSSVIYFGNTILRIELASRTLVLFTLNEYIAEVYICREDMSIVTELIMVAVKVVVIPVIPWIMKIVTWISINNYLGGFDGFDLLNKCQMMHFQ